MTQNTYQITILNAPDNTSYALYLDGIPKLIAGGRTQGLSYSFTVPKEFTGHGKIKFYIPVLSRVPINNAFSIEIDASGDNLIIDVSPYTKPWTPRKDDEQTASDKRKKFLQNKLAQEVQERKKQIKKEDNQEQKKTLLQNDLRRKVSQRRKSISSKASFWNKLK